MQVVVQRLVDTFPENPAAQGRAIRELADWDWGNFKEAALSLLAADAESQGARYLVAVLLRGDTLEKAVCQPSLFPLPQARAITKIASGIDPQFDLNLARRLTATAGIDEHEAVRILKILEENSNGVRLQPFLSQLLTHANQHIRSKAALLIGRSNRNPEWAGNQMQDSDARVRANAVEALWGIDDPACTAFFKEAMSDPNQRVAGNALVGLYKRNDTSCIRMLFDLAARPDPAWQTAAAWAMGETGSPRFQSILTRLVTAGDSKVRQHAIRALSRIRQYSRASQLGVPFLISLRYYHAGTSGAKVVASVTADGKGPVPTLAPLDFLLVEDKEIVEEYTVQQFRAPPVLAVGLAVPQTPGFAEHDLLPRLEHKRRADYWCLQRYAVDPHRRLNYATTQGILHLDAPPEAARISRAPFVSDPAGLARAMQDNDAPNALPEGVLGSIRSMLEDVMVISASRHLICLYTPSSIAIAEGDLAAIVARAHTGKVSIHSIAMNRDSNLHALQTLSSRTGGTFQVIAGPEEIDAALESVQISLLDRYELIFQSKNPHARSLKLWICSRLGHGEATVPISSRAMYEVHGS